MTTITHKPENLASLIFFIRGEKVLLDTDLAALYGVEARALNQAVARNRKRFPDDFMFRVAGDEYEHIRSRFVTTSDAQDSHSAQSVRSGKEGESLRSQTVISKGRGGRRYLPYAFTEQGVAMLSSVLRSPRAVEVNIAFAQTYFAIQTRRARTLPSLKSAKMRWLCSTVASSVRSTSHRKSALAIRREGP